MIIGGLPSHRDVGARLVHQRAHAADGGIEADEDRLADQEMPDVEFADFGDGGDRASPCRKPRPWPA